MPTSNGGYKETKIYNLDAFNKICMTFIDNDICQQVRQKFSDILSEVETTGSYGVAQKVQDEKFGTLSSYPVEAFMAVYPELTIK